MSLCTPSGAVVGCSVREALRGEVGAAECARSAFSYSGGRKMLGGGG